MGASTLPGTKWLCTTGGFSSWICPPLSWDSGMQWAAGMGGGQRKERGANAVAPRKGSGGHTVGVCPGVCVISPLPCMPHLAPPVHTRLLGVTGFAPSLTALQTRCLRVLALISQLSWHQHWANPQMASPERIPQTMPPLGPQTGGGAKPGPCCAPRQPLQYTFQWGEPPQRWFPVAGLWHGGCRQCSRWVLSPGAAGAGQELVARWQWGAPGCPLLWAPGICPAAGRKITLPRGLLL